MIENTPEIFHNNWIRGESFVFVIFVIDNQFKPENLDLNLKLFKNFKENYFPLILKVHFKKKLSTAWKDFHENLRDHWESQSAQLLNCTRLGVNVIWIKVRLEGKQRAGRSSWPDLPGC